MLSNENIAYNSTTLLLFEGFKYEEEKKTNPKQNLKSIIYLLTDSHSYIIEQAFGFSSLNICGA